MSPSLRSASETTGPGRFYDPRSVLRLMGSSALTRGLCRRPKEGRACRARLGPLRKVPRETRSRQPGIKVRAASWWRLVIGAHVKRRRKPFLVPLPELPGDPASMGRLRALLETVQPTTDRRRLLDHAGGRSSLRAARNPVHAGAHLLPRRTKRGESEEQPSELAWRRPWRTPRCRVCREGESRVKSQEREL